MKLLLLFGLFSSSVFGVGLERNPIYAQIIKNKPKINKKYAMDLSSIIHNVTGKYHISPRIFTAILMQESSYQLEARGCHWGIEKIDVYDPNNPDTISFIAEKETKVCSDFGIGQIYYKTAKSFGFKMNKLTTDLKYSVDAAAQVLSDFRKRYESREIFYWTRYNASSKDKRKVYRKLVQRYL